MASSGSPQWYVAEDGCIPIGEPAIGVTYHLALNSIIVTTDEPAIKIYDVTSGSVLQKSNLSVSKGDRIRCTYLPEKNQVAFSNTQAIGVRSDLHGVLLLDTALQTPVAKQEDNIKLELLLAEGVQLLKSLMNNELCCGDYTDQVVKELEKQIELAREATKGNHKTTKWATVCISTSHVALKMVCSSLVTEMKRLNIHSPGLSIASAVSDRLGYLLPNSEIVETVNGTVERTLMYSEAARRETFTKWPHMNYKWALPDPMAQAGFYHQPNVSGDDRAMCFTCNVCLVCWEPTDEPWSEHERHSPSCPFVKGEHTQNVPLSVTYSTQPAQAHCESGDKIACVSTTACEDYMATSTSHGNVVVWNLQRKLKRYCQFVIMLEDLCAVMNVDNPGLRVSGTEMDAELDLVDSLEVSQTQSPAQTIPSSSSECTTSGPKDCIKVEDQTDARSVPMKEVLVTSPPVSFSGWETNDKDQGSGNDATESQVSETSSFMRPNDDLIVDSLCLVEKPKPGQAGEGKKSESLKKSSGGKVKRRPLNPSLICGVGIHRTRLATNEEDEGGGKDVQAEVQLMNKVNKVVSCGESSEIISSTASQQSAQDVEMFNVANFVPYLLVVATKEESMKVSKQLSTDSLKPSTSMGNMVPSLQCISGQHDWSVLDHIYDSDTDMQPFKPSAGPGSLSTSSPTEGTKPDESSEVGTSHSLPKIPVIQESAISQHVPIHAGSVLQCVKLPKDFQSEHLYVKHICPLPDGQHLVVVVSRRYPYSARKSESSRGSVTTVSTEFSDNADLTASSMSDVIQTESTFSSSTSANTAASADGNTNNVGIRDSLPPLASYGGLLVYKFSYDCDTSYTCIEETPVLVHHVKPSEMGVERVTLLPQDVVNSSEDDDPSPSESFSAASVQVTDSMSKGSAVLTGQVAVIYTSGVMKVLNLSDLSQVARVEPNAGDKFTDVTYCSGIDRLCLCSVEGMLYFYQLSEDRLDPSDSVMDGETTGPGDLPQSVFMMDGPQKDDGVEQSYKLQGSELLAKQSLTFDSLCELHNLIQFENLMPRFTATVPPCWNEIQQEQQQRRHPQHLQHQGEATQHTRTWKLQRDSSTWDEHLFEIVLPRVCCVGHVDVKFTISPLCSIPPKIQVTLLKQNISAIGRQANSDPDNKAVAVDSKINFSIKSASYLSDESDSSSSSGSPPLFNNVIDPQFLENHHAEILCGPVDLANCLDLSGNTGIVSLTSPQLLMSKPRSFLIHVKGFPVKKEPVSEKGKDHKKKRTAAQASEKLRSKTIKSLFDNYSPTTGRTKVESLQGCDWLSELSITVRKTKKTNIPKDRTQRLAMIELNSFHDKLLSTVSFVDGYLLPGVSPDHVQNMCLDILNWVTNIQMNDPTPRSSRCVLSSIQARLRSLVEACFIQGTRTTAHKCARLLSLCMEYSKCSSDPDLAPLFSLHLLEALLECLPMLPCMYSAGSLKWFFTLLNRVKCMEVTTVSAKCCELLNALARTFDERTSPLHALLKARYGLNGHPFEPDLFDTELPQTVRQSITGSPPTASAFTSSTGANTTSSSQSTGAQQSNQDEMDFYDLFNHPTDKSTKSLLDTAHNHVLGMLEVEPLHFSCHSTSDGTKMERLDSVSSGPTTVVNTTGLGSSNISGTINFGETLSMPPVTSSLLYSIPHTVAAAKLQHEVSSVKSKMKQILYEVGKNTPMSTQKTPTGSSELMPSTPKTTPQVMTPPLTPPNEAWHQIFSQSEKLDSSKSQSQRPQVPVQPSHSLLQPPPPQVLVIERIYSGARRFVILDFGKPILLTDVIIPLCVDLASLSIDVWVQGEEVDGQRLVVAADIGVRSLVMNNIMPAPVCRYLKITTIGRYGSGTTRSKIPIGAFYGHSYILPWEWNQRHETCGGSHTTASGTSQVDYPTHSQLLTQLGSFLSLLEDIQCRYSLSRSRLQSLLLEVESLQYASYHTQYYLKKSKNNDEDNNIIQTYNECIQLQMQQNLAVRAIDRLQSALGLRQTSVHHTPSLQLNLRHASTDKLRMLLENLLETTISITQPSPSIPQAPASLYASLDYTMCQDIFKHLCFHGTPRMQILTGMMLVRVCGSQPWFGDFLGNILQEYFHVETAQVFSQDRVFILLTALGQRSLQGPSSVSIMESLLSMLARVLSPVLDNQSGGRSGLMTSGGHVDLTLIGWILLFLCRNLDNTLVPSSGNEEEGGAGKKEQVSNLSNRWNFIQANSNVRSQIGKSKSVKLYRRSLHKRLLHHKQKLLDLEHMKKSFLAQEQSHNALLKHQEKQFRKELSQYASKHLKDIIQIRKNAEVLTKMPREDRHGSEDRDTEYDTDAVLTLPKNKCLPVVQGLMALLLSMDFTCNVDLFLITCKVLARICISTRPAITLTEVMTQEQLEKLIMLVANLEFNHGNISWGGPWAGHALTCLLQDILEGEKAYPSSQYDGITDDEISVQVTDSEESLQSGLPSMDLSTEGAASLPLSCPMANGNLSDQDIPPDTSSSMDESKLGMTKESMLVHMLLKDDLMEPDVVEIMQPSLSPAANVVFNSLPEGYQEKLAGKKGLFGSTGYPKPPIPPIVDKTLINNVTGSSSGTSSSSVSQGLSTALDSRLELGLEMQSELRLKVMLSLLSDAVQGAFVSALPLPPGEVRCNGHSRLTPTDDEMMESVSNVTQITSSEMLSSAFDNLFGQLLQQRVSHDALLQLWLTLNEDSSSDSGDPQSTFDPKRTPAIPLSVASVTSLLAFVAQTPSHPVRTWVLVFQTLTLLANLRLEAEDHGIDRSMVIAMLADRHLVALITKFLSGTSVNGTAASFESTLQVGPSAVKAFHVFLQRLQISICGEDNIHHLKEIMLKLVYTLTAERGAFHAGLGPLDAQCKFLEFILDLRYEQVDVNNAISVIDSVSALVNRHILCQERVYCRSTLDNGINARSCFGGLFSNLLRSGDQSTRSGDCSRDQLMSSLLKLVNSLLQVQSPSRSGRGVSVESTGEAGLSESVSDSTKLSNAMAGSSPHSHPSSRRSSPFVGPSSEQMAGQTDEQKTESANQERVSNTSSSESQAINLSDIILGRNTIMCNFIQALSYCNSNTMAMILGSSGMPGTMQDSFTSGDPLSVGDAIYQLLVTMSRNCHNSRLLMDSLFQYLSGRFPSQGSSSLCRLSEPLLWFLLKVLDSPNMLRLFIDKGGVKVVCENFVNCNSRIISTSPSLISTIMQNMNARGNTDKKRKWETDSSDGLQNFAPLGTIVSFSPTASAAEVLIVSTPQHRRARAAPWSYHFYPDEAWVDLKITLPFAILLKEVQIQPHSPALSTCPSYVSLEASQDGITSFPLCAPMSTGSLVYIKLQLQRPEIVTSVTIRLHKARDSMTIGLSQILLMGYSAFGEVGYKTNNLFLPTEDFVSRSSVGWVRLLHHCLVSQVDLEGVVAEAAAPTPGLLSTCAALLVSPISTVYSPTIEAVLLRLGLHSGEMGMALIDSLLRSNGSSSGHVSAYLGKVSGVANESTVEILYQLGMYKDRWTDDRVRAMLQWLGDSARVALQRKAVFSDDGFRHIPHEVSSSPLPGPAPAHVHCIAAVLWQSIEQPGEHNLSHLINQQLVSSLYEWSTVLSSETHLKKAVDHVLCSVCYICPEYFTRIMEWMGIGMLTGFGMSASISDDRKDSSQYNTSMTDDSKEASHARGHSVEAAEIPTLSTLQQMQHMCLDEAHLSTLALACKSPVAARQLLESSFPAVLAQGLFEFCNRVISTFSNSWSPPEGISDNCKSMNGNTGDTASSSRNNTGLCVTADMVAPVLNFFSEVSSLPQLTDWLGGADGNIFWPVLLTMLCNTPLHSAIPAANNIHRVELISAEERSAVETAAVNFFSSVISCHIPNQMLFAKVLYDVIKEQGTANKTTGAGVCPLSGFTRRVFLQVLLEDERILVAFRSTPQQYRVHHSMTNQLQHPQFGAGRKFRTMVVNMHMSIGELVNKISDTPSLAAQLLEYQNDKKSDESKKETSQIGLEIVENIYAANAVEAGTLEKDSSPSLPSKVSIPPRPPTRRGRATTDALSKQLSIPVLSLNQKFIANRTLPHDLTLSQLVQVLQSHGQVQGLSVLDFVLQLQPNNGEAKSKDLSDDPDEVPEEVLLASPSFPTALQIFATVGGLALLAEHLPLLYPEISRQINAADTNNEAPSGPDSDFWVTVDNYQDDQYEMYEPLSPAPTTTRNHNIGSPTIPPHSLVAFGLFLRLPGYAEVLLKKRKKAQCLLRLVLGVTDDGAGGHVLTSPIASSLPTLPFIVLKSLFDASPLTTDDGVLLRRMCLDIGALHLILACLSVLSHHAPRVSLPGFQQEAHSILSAMQAPSSAPAPTVQYSGEEKSQQYWAKGTGFGTGSTTSSWDAEQALVRQRSEEEHVTCLLQVMASYINPGGSMPANFEYDDYVASMEKCLLPDVVPGMLTQSCLIPAMSSYLRNDSVLDMARHVPLYRSLLQLLRAISVYPSLVVLLLPQDKETNSDSTIAVGELLEKMRACVDTYASRLKTNHGKMTGSKEEEEENEGLAMLIPDIQETARIVHISTERMKDTEDCGNEMCEKGSEEMKDNGKGSFDEIYLTEMQKLQFGQYEMVEEEGSNFKFTVHYHYENNVKSAGDIKNPNRIRRLAQEAVTLSTSLPLSVSSSVFVRCDEERLDIMKVLITGPEDTPYANGCFEFDVYFPGDYPNAPPYINLETTGYHTVRFNPNLYNDGKVCLSVLNTWHGRPEEKWSAQTSSFLQVLVSIQSLILVCEPYFNEPGYERSRGTPSGTASSREYDANIRQATVKWAILEQLKNPCICFKEIIQKHFWLKRHKILKQCEEWIAEMESYSSDKRNGRSIAQSTVALKKHYNQLREEFARMQPPEGLEDVEKGAIDPKEKHYSTDVAGSSGLKDLPQVVPADNNANCVIAKDDLKQVTTAADC